jgi:hypothetical protein
MATLVELPGRTLENRRSGDEAALEAAGAHLHLGRRAKSPSASKSSFPTWKA